MAGLLDYIFSTLDIENLEKENVMKYLCYLQEITPQVHTIEDTFKFCAYRVRLTKRMMDLDRKAFKDLERRLTNDRHSIALKKVKYHLV